MIDQMNSKVILRSATRMSIVRTVQECLELCEWDRHATQFEPAVLDKAIAAMNYMSRYKWFVKYLLQQNYIFCPVRAAVQFFRRVGVVEGG